MTYSKKEFYKSLEDQFREGSLQWNFYFINLHFLDFSIDFCREFRHMLNLKEIYMSYVGEGELWVLKQDERRYREFFGDKDYD